MLVPNSVTLVNNETEHEIELALRHSRDHRIQIAVILDYEFLRLIRLDPIAGDTNVDKIVWMGEQVIATLASKSMVLSPDDRDLVMDTLRVLM